MAGDYFDPDGQLIGVRFAGRSCAPILTRGYRPRVHLHPGRGGVPA